MMPDLTSSTPIDLTSLLNNIEAVKYNPAGIQTVILSALEDASNGLINIVDPSNPFIFLLEASCVNTVAAINENDLNTFKQYSKMALTADDLYTHMSDVDYLNSFATPSSTTFTFMIEENSFLANAVEAVTNTNVSYVTIPRNTVVNVNGINFSLVYPIHIVKYADSNIYKVVYDSSANNQISIDTNKAIMDLKSNIIQYVIRRDSNNNSYISFEVPMMQFSIITGNYQLQASGYFNQVINFNTNFYFARVYYNNNNTGGEWLEIKTTFTDQVFDPNTLTALLKIVGKKLQVTIPPIYVSNGLISGMLRVDVYETDGYLQLDMSNNGFDDFKTSLIAIDPNEQTIYVSAMTNVLKLIYSDQKISAGINSLDFETLRQTVINNTTGNVILPITSTQLDTHASYNGFKLVKNIDVVTNRTMLAVQSLPSPSNNKLITPMNLAINTFITSFKTLRNLALQAGGSVIDNTKGNDTGRITITPKALYLNTDGKITLYPDSQVSIIKNASINDQIAIVNKLDFIFSPFYYVLDNASNDFVVRAYSLDNPSAKDLDFYSQNNTALMSVFTSSYNLIRYGNGYKLTTTVSSDPTYKAVADSFVGAQLSFTPYGENGLASIVGTLLKDNSGNAILTNDERTFEFIIETNFDVDSNDNLILTNFLMSAINNVVTGSSLDSYFTILYFTSAPPNNAIPDISNNDLATFLTPINSMVITKEKIRLLFGYSLTNMWRNCRTIANSNTYQTYESDVYAKYTEDVYEVDNSTGSIFSFDGDGNIQYNILHKAGDPVLDNNNVPVKLHSKGDIVLVNNVPVPISDVDNLKSLDILFMEGVYYFTTNTVHLQYKEEVIDTLMGWIVDDISNMKNIMLEKTVPYFYTEKKMGYVTILNRNNIKINIEARQSFVVNLYVTDIIYNDDLMRTNINSQVVNVLQSQLNNKTFSISNATQALLSAFNGNILGVSLSGLGGDSNYDIVTLINDQEKLSINKVLANNGDGFLVANEDIVINYFTHQV